MTNDESAFREVDQSLAEDRQWELFRQNGPMLIGAASMIVLAVGGWQFWQAQKQSAADQAAVEFRDIMTTLEETPDEGRDALLAFAGSAPDGYAVLAEFRRAASLARGGAREEALSIYRKIYEDRSASKRLRDLARIRSSYLSISEGREAVQRDIGSLQEDASVFGSYAREIVAVAALSAEDFETAMSMFERTALDPKAPASVRVRAEEFAALASAGKSGVNLTGAARAEDLIDALERGGQHAGDEHDHSEDDHAGESDPAEEGVAAEGAAPGNAASRSGVTGDVETPETRDDE